MAMVMAMVVVVRDKITMTKPRKLGAAFGSVILLSITQSSWAGTLTVAPGLDLAYNQTDNLTLSRDNEIRDTITELTPSININYQGNRTLANLNYQLQSLRYSKNSDNDENFEQLNSLVNTQLISQVFWLNMAYNIQQRTIDDTADQLQGNIFANGNNADVKDAVLQPILRGKSGNINFEFIADLSQQRFDSDTNVIAQFDSDTENYNFSISSDNQGQGFNWAINTIDSKTTFSDDTENETSSTELQLDVDITDQVLFTSTYGRDDNDLSTNNEDLLSSNYWSSGLTWNPTTRTSFNFSTGDRFGQSNSNLSAIYQNRSWVVQLSSNKELLINGLDTDTLLNPNPNQVFDNPLTNSPLIRRTNTVAISYNRSKLQFNLSYSEDERDLQNISNFDETDRNRSFTVTWFVHSRTSISLQHSDNDDEIPAAIGAARTDDIIQQTLSVNRQISTNSELSLLIRSQKRESTDNAFDYNEQGYQLNFSHQF